MKNIDMQRGSSTVGWVVGALVIGVAIIVLAVVSGDGSRGQAGSAHASIGGVSETDWIRGTASSTVSLIEYGDFECPACGAFEPIVKDMETEFGDRVAFVYRHFPLRNIHANADIAARASEAAGEQGKFWEMHDMLYSRQAEWSEETGAENILVGYAEELGLNTDTFKSALKSASVRGSVQEDATGALSAGINSTPTFFLNGERIQPRNAEELRGAIKAALTAPEATSTPLQ